MIVRLGRVHDSEGRLTHVMCCICFEFIAVAELHVDDRGEKWDLCTKPECLEQGGIADGC